MVQSVSATAVFDVAEPSPPPMLKYTAPPSPPASTTQHIQISLSTCRVLPPCVVAKDVHIYRYPIGGSTQPGKTYKRKQHSQSLLAQTWRCVVCHGAVSQCYTGVRCF